MWLTLEAVLTGLERLSSKPVHVLSLRDISRLALHLSNGTLRISLLCLQ